MYFRVSISFISVLYYIQVRTRTRSPKPTSTLAIVHQTVSIFTVSFGYPWYSLERQALERRNGRTKPHLRAVSTHPTYHVPSKLACPRCLFFEFHLIQNFANTSARWQACSTFPFPTPHLPSQAKSRMAGCRSRTVKEINHCQIRNHCACPANHWSLSSQMSCKMLKCPQAAGTN